MIETSDSLFVFAPRSDSAKYLKHGTAPYTSLQDVLDSLVVDYRSIGQQVLVNINGKNVRYIFRQDINGLPDLVPDLNDAAPLDSPSFTGSPSTPDLATTDNSNKIANSKYVKAVVQQALGNVTGGGGVKNGGAVGQVYTKTGVGDYDADWRTPSASGGSAFGSSLIVSGLVDDGSETDFTAGTDNSAVLQAAIDYCIQNKVRTMYIPVGKYRIDHPLIVRSPNSPYCSLSILAEDRRFNSGKRTMLVCNFNDTFGIAFHLNKGSVLDGIGFVGKFAAPSSSASNKIPFYNTPFANWGSGARDDRYSPYAAVVIDPFTNIDNNTVYSAYPGLESQYGMNIGGINSRSGSTGITIRNCTISGFVVGIASSVNGWTRNQEECVIEYCYFDNVKVCVTGGQDQEKNNFIRNCTFWGGYRFFCTGTYGAVRQAGHWNISGINCAGAVVEFIDNDQHGYFPTHIRDIFCESVGRFGRLNTQITSNVTNFHADWDDASYYIGQNIVIDVQGQVNFNACSFRYYNGNNPGTPVLLRGGFYTNCQFGGAPIDVQKFPTARFLDCQGFVNEVSDTVIEYNYIGWFRNNIPMDSTLKMCVSRYGEFSLVDKFANKYLQISGNETFFSFLKDATLKAVALSDTPQDKTFTFTTTVPESYTLKQIVALSTTVNAFDAAGWGMVTAISGNTITVERVSASLPNGNYYVIPLYANETKVAFTGNIISATEINSLTMTWGANLTDAVGNIYKTPAGIFKIISYDGTKFTVSGVLPAVQNSYSFA